MLRVRAAVADDRLKYDNGEPLWGFARFFWMMVAEEGERERSKRKRRTDSSFY